MSMKKKVLCLFSLILYLLSACTILSLKIEEEMAVLAEVDERISEKTVARSITLSLRAVYTDMDGDHLYEVREGKGWESGLRIHEFPSFSMDMMQGTASIYGTGDYRLIKSSSRQPQAGKLAIVVDEFETVNDRYLLYYEDGIPKARDFPDNAKLIGQSENAFLLDMTGVSLPFFAHTIETQSVVTDMSDRIFSLTEAARFLEQIPSAVMVFIFLIAGIVFWGAACLFSVRVDANKLLIWINAILTAVSLWLMASVLNSIDLPASMLPVNNIFDWKYYSSQLSLVFGCLSDFGMTDLLHLRDTVTNQCLKFIQRGALAVLLTAIAQMIIQYIMNRKNRHKI